jgi:hypothetical protein
MTGEEIMQRLHRGETCYQILQDSAKPIKKRGPFVEDFRWRFDDGATCTTSCVANLRKRNKVAISFLPDRKILRVVE